MFARGLDLLEILHAGGVVAVGGILGEDFAVADDGVERRTQLVAHVGEERRFRARGRFRLRACLDRLIARRLNVAGIVAKHDQRPAHVAQLIRPGCGDRRREVAACDRKHAGGQRVEPRHDVTVHEQRHDEARQRQRGDCDQH